MTIPIVMTNSTDPVDAGLVASLARPGGNVTGFSSDTGDEINGKRLEFLKDTLPNLSRVGILWNPDFARNQSRLTSMREATQALGLTLIPAEARGPDALEQAFARSWTQQEFETWLRPKSMRAGESPPKEKDRRGAAEGRRGAGSAIPRDRFSGCGSPQRRSEH